MRFGILAKFTLALALVCGAIFVINVVVLIPGLDDRKPAPGIVKQPIAPSSKIPDFGAIADIKEKKTQFFGFIRPGVQLANQRIQRQRDLLLTLQAQWPTPANDAQRLAFREIAEQYKLPRIAPDETGLAMLLERVDIVPEALILVQAANESGWGTSRFARQGLNFFGQWCFTRGCGLVPRSRNSGADHEVQVFDTVDEAIGSYLNNLNTHQAYEHFRSIRADLRRYGQPLDPQILVTGLRNYSERQDNYVIELSQMLRHNKAYLN